MNAVYLDYAATAPLRAEALEAMLPLLGGLQGNPSALHGPGRRARVALENARERVAALFGAHPAEIVFTRGGTEADNLAVLGRARAAPGSPVVCSAVEHRAVLEAVHAAGAEGAPTRIVPVDGDGRVGIATANDVLRERPAVVSVMWGNNETGALQPIRQWAEQASEAGFIFHSDAVQALGRIAIRVDRTPVSLLSFSAHKVGGPRGVGALFVRRGTALAPLLHGGGQERGLRPGTEDVAGVVAFAVAAELAESEREAEAERLTRLRDRLERQIRDTVPELVVHAAGAERLPHISFVSVPGADRELLLAGLDLAGVAASAGSACSSGAVRVSHVLEAMGVPAESAAAAVRFSLGRGTTEAEADRAAAVFTDCVARCRALA